jgi:TolB-like protein/DNA-binding winged helix-turn-helix (wHTH) protein
MSEPQYRFAEFQLDCASFELRRQGRTQKSERISLERIPMELLILLLERQGSVVTRQEIVDRLWGKDVFVDTEHGINTAVRKIRQALRDDPDQPRFILTVSGKGYRFVAGDNGNRRSAAPAPSETPTALPEREPRPSGSDVPDRGSVAAVMPAVQSNRAKLAIVIAICVVVAAIFISSQRHRIVRANQASQIHSIAVIPLANLSGDPAQDYFADGMTDELITALAKNRSLRVVSRTSAMQYKGVNRPLPDIARELNVDGILEGSIERTPTSMHMTVQLIYAPTDTHVWAESYNRDLNEFIFLPEELSQTIAKEVKAAVSPPTRQRSISPEAHDAYLEGLYFWYRGDFDSASSTFKRRLIYSPTTPRRGPGSATVTESEPEAILLPRRPLPKAKSISERPWNWTIRLRKPTSPWLLSICSMRGIGIARRPKHGAPSN